MTTVRSMVPGIRMQSRRWATGTTGYIKRSTDHGSLAYIDTDI